MTRFANPASNPFDPLFDPLVLAGNLAGALGLAAIAYGGTCLALYYFQRKLIFKPQRTILNTPADIGIPYEDVWISVNDSESGGDGGPGHDAGHDTGKLHGWWLPNPESDQTLLFFHGNYGNISHNLKRIHFHRNLGFSVLAIDYRGYGQSIGTDAQGQAPTEQTTYTDASAAWHYLTKERNIAPKNITVCGHSLGGAIAINLAIQHPHMARLIVKSSFTTMKDAVLAKEIYSLFPVELMLTEIFDSLGKVKQLQVPVLYVHGAEDPDVPAHMSQSLYEASPEPKQLWLAPDADHNNVSALQGDSYGKVVRSFCRGLQLQPS
ncbi:MAG: alpha/beta hydrolase [Cyanobacteria bacterium P01_F01_bin.53]